MNATPHGPAFQTLGEQIDAVSERVTEILSELDEKNQQIATLADQLTKAVVAGWCDVCCGRGEPASGVPCICGGTGQAADAVTNLRVKHLLVDAAKDAAESRAIALVKALQDLVSSHDGYPHGLGPCVCTAHEVARVLLRTTTAGGGQ